MERKMENIYKILKQGLIQLVPVLSLIFVFNDTFSACFGDVQRGGGFYGPSLKLCAWKQSDNTCNSDSQCCPGDRCSTMGRCEPCCC